MSFKLWKFLVAINLFITNNILADKIVDLIRKEGFPAESHSIQTRDGYILAMQRIPRKLPPQSNKVVILAHGMFCSAADFVDSGKDSLGFELFKNGYDVWMLNNRGTSSSRKHINLDPRKLSFWEFSWHEMGIDDLPVTIDYILNITGKPALHYIGHSQGGTIFFVMLSEHPKYNEKIISAHLMAPIAYMKNLGSVIIQTLVANLDTLEPFLRSYMFELPPHAKRIRLLLRQLCVPEALGGRDKCSSLLSSSLGKFSSSFQWDKIQTFGQFLPATISYKAFTHFGANCRADRFMQYDYGREKNLEAYGKETPPEYNLTATKVPTQMFHCANDLLLSEIDFKRLAAHVKTTIKSFIVPDCNHLDFLLGRATKDFVHSRILEMLAKYELV